MNSQKYYKLIHYDNEDDYQLGHGKIKDIMTTVNSNPRIPFVTQDSLFVNENPVL